MSKGLTLIELIIAAVMLTVLTGITAYVFIVLLKGWVDSEARTGIDIKLDRGMEEMVRSLREAEDITAINNDEIRFSADPSTHYIYYLYTLLPG